MKKKLLVGIMLGAVTIMASCQRFGNLTSGISSVDNNDDIYAVESTEPFSFLIKKEAFSKKIIRELTIDKSDFVFEELPGSSDKINLVYLSADDFNVWTSSDNGIMMTFHSHAQIAFSQNKVFASKVSVRETAHVNYSIKMKNLQFVLERTQLSFDNKRGTGAPVGAAHRENELAVRDIIVEKITESLKSHIQSLADGSMKDWLQNNLPDKSLLDKSMSTEVVTRDDGILVTIKPEAK